MTDAELREKLLEMGYTFSGTRPQAAIEGREWLLKKPSQGRADVLAVGFPPGNMCPSVPIYSCPVRHRGHYIFTDLGNGSHHWGTYPRRIYVPTPDELLAVVTAHTLTGSWDWS